MVWPFLRRPVSAARVVWGSHPAGLVDWRSFAKRAPGSYNLGLAGELADVFGDG